MFSQACVTGEGRVSRSWDMPHGRIPTPHPPPNMGPGYLRPPYGYGTWIPPPSPRHGTWISYLLLTSGGHHWRPVQTCSLEYLPPTSTDTYWQPPKHMQLASSQYASYWYAVLFDNGSRKFSEYSLISCWKLT